MKAIGLDGDSYECVDSREVDEAVSEVGRKQVSECGADP